MSQLMKHNIEIKEQLMLNTQLLQELVRRQRGIDKDKIGSLPQSCNLPLKAFDELMALEQQLKSKEFYSQLVSYFSSLLACT